MNIEIWLEDKEMEEYEKEMAEMNGNLVGRWYIRYSDKLVGVVRGKVVETLVYDTGDDEYLLIDTIDSNRQETGKANKNKRYFNRMRTALENCKKSGWVEDYMILEF